MGVTEAHESVLLAVLCYIKARVGALGEEISPAPSSVDCGGCKLSSSDSRGYRLSSSDCGGCWRSSADDCAGLQAICMYVGTHKHHTHRYIHAHTHIHAHTPRCSFIEHSEDFYLPIFQT